MQLEFVRANLSSALLNVPPSRNHQIASMGGSISGSQCYLVRPTRKISFENYEVTVDADPVRCSETRSYKGSKILITPEAYELASWRRVVSLLPETYQAWTRYCYGDVLNFNDQIIICQHAWAAFLAYQAEIGAKRMSKKITALFQKLVWLAVQDSKSFMNRREYAYGSADLAKLTGLTVENWCGNYQPRWSALLQVIEVLDQEALMYADQQHRTESDRR